MNRNLRSLAGVGLLATVIGMACKGDPTAGLVGGVSSVTTSLSYITVNVGDSILVSATVRDSAGNPVIVAATPTSSDANVLTVSAGPGTPVPKTQFYIKGVSYGTGSVTVTAGAATATINVRTFPAFVAIVGSRDSLLSGATRQLSFQPQDQSLNSITVADTFTWASSNSAVLTVDQTGLITSKTPGIATISVTGPGSPNDVSASAQFSVVPAPFGGTLSIATASPTQAITVTKAAADPAFDADVAASVGGSASFVENNTGNTIDVIMPVLGKTGSAPLLITNIGSSQLARSAAFTSASAAITDPDSPNGDAIGSEIVLTNKGDYFGILRGSCVQGGDIEGGTESPGDKCDKYYKVTNGAATPDTIVVQLDWLDGKGSSSDIDMIGCNTSCSGSFNFQGATSANPEKMSLVVPAGATRLIVIEEFDNKGLPAMLFRMRISKGLP